MYYYQRRLLEEAAKYASKETEITEVWWKGDGPLSKQEADSLLDDLESAYKKGGLNGTMQIPNGDSGPVWEMLSGLKQFLRGEPKNTIAHIIAGVKKFLKPGDLNSPKLKGLFESLDEDAHFLALDKIKLVKKEEGEVNEYYRRSGFRSSSYSGDPRWITAKYAGTDAKGRSFKKGEEVLYYPNGKKIYSGPEAEKMWREFQSAKGDEMSMPYAS